MLCPKRDAPDLDSSSIIEFSLVHVLTNLLLFAKKAACLLVIDQLLMGQQLIALIRLQP
ncbi:hypothetical protein [Coleofasciculus sp. F4-SAH-05]|jgi:hypothetical protein|uniref:hypothetical protein n=1 Tax=Coleofasciculus TaxID=669368 RepID=UPI0032F593C3